MDSRVAQSETLRLVQLINGSNKRQVAMIAEPDLVFLKETDSVYDLALKAISENKSLITLTKELVSDQRVTYDPIYTGRSEWKLLPAFDHPDNPAACLVSGTGLTHKNSALNRQAMHQKESGQEMNDSIEMYQWGEEKGNPGPDIIGIQPEWFYKGNGAVLRAHGSNLVIPSFGDDGGEEPEVVTAYVVDQQGIPRRIGYCIGNEFSDHVMEKKNYLYLAPSKLRTCSIGPELVIGLSFDSISGYVKVSRQGETLWRQEVNTGQQNMSHSLQNLEHHHFKYAEHRIPFQAHVHYLGADAFSYGVGLRLEQGDEMEVSWDGLGRPLINRVKIESSPESIVKVKPIG